MSVVLEERGSALWARIDRPSAGNACDTTVMSQLEEWLSRAGDHRVLVLTGTGRSFCAGADLVESRSLLGDVPALMAFLDRGRSLVRSVLAAPVPTIAAVNGAAFGGGLELLLACDIAVAGPQARIGDRHIAVGQVPGWGSSILLPRAVGPSLARRLLISGETWTPAQAFERGLVSDVADDLDKHVDELAERIAGLDRAAVHRMLRVARPRIAPEEWNHEWDVLGEHIRSQAGG